MIIYYPTYYLVPVAPVISLYEDEYSTPYSDEYRSRYNNMDGNELYNTYRNINDDIFYEVDEEYVNSSIK